MNPDGPVQAGPGARSPSGKAHQNLRGAAPRFRRNPLTPPSGAPHTPPAGAARGDPGSDQRESCPATPSLRASIPQRRCEKRTRPRSLPRPSYPLPASLLGQQRDLGKLGPFGSWPSSALLVWTRVTVFSWLLFALGEGRNWGRTPPTTAASGTPTAHPPLAPLTLLRRSPPRIRPWAGWSPCGGKSCFQRLF